MDDTNLLPQWAPRIPQAWVRELYENDARGMPDETLIDEVGAALLARCQSFCLAVAASEGKAACARCGNIILHHGDKAEVLHCSECGWELTWGEYFSTIQHKQLSGAEPVLKLFREYIARFPSAGTVREKTLLIDALIHGYHWYYKDNSPTRPVAINLIEGRLNEVIAFLDSLSYADATTPGLMETHTTWVQNSQNARHWSDLKDAP